MMLHEAIDDEPGFQSVLAYGRGSRVEDKGMFLFAYQPEIYLQALLTRVSGLQGYGSRLSTRRLIQFIKTWEPDIVHCHNLHGYYLNLELAEFLNSTDIPMVWTIHDCWPFTGRCAYFSECMRWKSGCGNCPDLTSYPRTAFDTSAFMWRKKKKYFGQLRGPVLVCPSQWLAGHVKESYLGKFRIEVICNAVDTNVFKPCDRENKRNQLGISDKKVILLAAADLADKRKGIRYFLEALQDININDLSVLTFGKQIDLPKNINTEIKQLGYISDHAELAKIYNAADLFCTTSLDEVFGLVVTESMACGTPVAGFHAGGISDQVTDDCGCLVTPGDSRALADAVTKLLENHEHRYIMGQNCRKRAVSNYSIEKFRTNHIELYKNLLLEKNP
jgi:glycosyltransferase involved in cell wall biosynthesis